MNPVERSDNPDIEDETHDLPVGVGIKDLRKVFKVISNHNNNRFVLVKFSGKLSFDMN